MPDRRRRPELHKAVDLLGLPKKERELALAGVDKMNDNEADRFLADVAEAKRLAALVAESPQRMGVRQMRTPATASATLSGVAENELARRQQTRKLTVGREIWLSGEITACDQLVIEGSVCANLGNCQDLYITESGFFSGAAIVDVADVRGRFEGTLNVRRLVVRNTGCVIGTVRYGQIMIERDGQISGDFQMQATSEATKNTVDKEVESSQAAQYHWLASRA